MFNTFSVCSLIVDKKNCFLQRNSVFFVFMIIANIFAFNQKREQIQRNYAIVTVGAASVNASPDENSNVLFELHEGTKVKIRNSDGNWYEIEIANGSVGWTPKQKVEII